MDTLTQKSLQVQFSMLFVLIVDLVFNPITPVYFRSRVKQIWLSEVSVSTTDHPVGFMFYTQKFTEQWKQLGYRTPRLKLT